MVMDYSDLKKIIEDEIINHYDHHYLNDVLNVPTSENMGMMIFDNIKEILLRDIKLESVEIKETENSSCKVEEC